MAITKVGIIGAGNMGSGIVQKTAQSGIEVVMVDINDEYVQRGMDNIKKTLEKGVEKKIFRPEQAEGILSKITGTTDKSAVSDCDLVIEVIFENLEIKKQLFKELDGICGENTILASNTSSFAITELAAATNRPDRFIGLHFFYHPAMNRLLEIIPGEQTSEAAIELGNSYSNMIGKTGIAVKDKPGFAVNRFFVPWLNEAARLHGEGISIPTIDETCKKVFKIGMGPFLLMNVTGVPIAAHTTESLGQQINGFYATCPKLQEQFESKKEWNLEEGEVDESRAQEVEERMLGAVFSVACELVSEGVCSVEDTDRGAKIGLRWSKGPFEMMNRYGIEKSYEIVNNFVGKYDEIGMPSMLQAQFDKKENFEFSMIDLSVKDGIATILFNRPEAMNAINEQVMNQLNARFTEAEGNPDVKAIVLEGAGKAFVAGADIGYFVKKIQSDAIDDIVKFTSYGHSVLNKIDNSEKLVIIKLDGLAMGGGVEIALAGDCIVATEKGSIALPETGIGIFPGLGGTQRTTRYVGKELAKYLVLTGKTLGAQEAKEIGLVEYVFDSAEVDGKIKELVASGDVITKANKGEVALNEKHVALKTYFDNSNLEKLLTKDESLDEQGAKLAKTIGFKAPIAIKMANQIIDEGAELELKDGLKKELDNLSTIFATKDALEGLKSVLERRRPSYTNE